jgi:hypothetical protein
VVGSVSMMLASTYSRRADERQKSDDGEDRRDETEMIVKKICA